MSESVRQLTRASFLRTINFYHNRGTPQGVPDDNVDAHQTTARIGWEIWLHETSPGNGFIEVYHSTRHEGKVRIPLSAVASYEERWTESPYKELLAEKAKASEEKKAAKQAAAAKQ
jgi:hypothetical protein